MQITKSEAIDMFKKWHAEKTPIRCQLPLSKLAAAFSAIVYSVSEELLILSSEDLRTELNIPLTPDLLYGYGDAPPNSSIDSEYGAVVIIFLEPIPAEGHGDMVALSEFKVPPSEI